MNMNFVKPNTDFLNSEVNSGLVCEKKAVVTGSALNAALWLDTLKKQQEHFDFVKYGKLKPEPNSDAQERMKHGTDNEINAVATLVTKILPVFFPHMSYVEEGCVKVSLGDSNMIVSPDGSCMDNVTHDTEMAIEIKCPFPPSPGSYKVPVFYTIPKFYVPQILSEMYALGAEELLFVCYSSESTTFMKATFCQKLWDSMSSEIVSVFGPNAIRPKRKSDKVP